MRINDEPDYLRVWDVKWLFHIIPSPQGYPKNPNILRPRTSLYLPVSWLSRIDPSTVTYAKAMFT